MRNYVVAWARSAYKTIFSHERHAEDKENFIKSYYYSCYQQAWYSVSSYILRSLFWTADEGKNAKFVFTCGSLHV